MTVVSWTPCHTDEVAMEREVIVEQGDADLPGADPLAVDRDVPRTELTAVALSHGLTLGLGWQTASIARPLTSYGGPAICVFVGDFP